ncbi:MAG: TPM domain-containing protein [Acidobacteriota bacterium]
MRSRLTPISWGLIGAGALFELAGAAVLVLWFLDPTHDSWERTRLGLGLTLLLAGTALTVFGALWHVRSLARSRNTPATFLTTGEEARVLEAIRSFERKTSGEIRVHLTETCAGDIVDEARRIFEKLGMTSTAQHNGVLIFVVTAERRMVVLGDSGIDAVVPAGFWNTVITEVSVLFAAGRHGDGLTRGVDMAGRELAQHFPPIAGDLNELPDTISRED